MIEKELWGYGPGGYTFSGPVEFHSNLGTEAGPFLMDWAKGHALGRPEVTTQVVSGKKGRILECRVKFPGGELLQFLFKEGKVSAEAWGNTYLGGKWRKSTDHRAILS